MTAFVWGVAFALTSRARSSQLGFGLRLPDGRAVPYGLGVAEILALAAAAAS